MEKVGYVNPLSLVFSVYFHGDTLVLILFHVEFASCVCSHRNYQAPPSSTDALDETDLD